VRHRFSGCLSKFQIGERASSDLARQCRHFHTVAQFLDLTLSPWQPFDRNKRVVLVNSEDLFPAILKFDLKLGDTGCQPCCRFLRRLNFNFDLV